MTNPTRLAATLLTLLATLAGCAALDRPTDARPARAIQVAVDALEVPGDDLWQVGYVLSEPAAGVEFVRDRNPFRHRLWTSAARDAEASWRVVGGRERLCFSRPVRAFSVAFRTWTEHLPKDYELNVAFSEGSRLLYTGHLRLRPLSDCEAAVEGSPPAARHRFAFRTAPERGIRVLDRSGTGALAPLPPRGGDDADTYAYFGNLSPAGDDSATVILDPGLPAWMKAGMADALPRLIARFTAETGMPLPFRPLLLVGWGGPGGSGKSFSGGTLPGLIVAAADGPGWLAEDDAARRLWFDRLAHEVFHLWDGEAFRPADDAEWLSEAAAEHFAVDAGLAFGVLTEADVQAWLVEQANDCLVRLGGRDLVTAGTGGGTRAWYTCGALAMAVADAALRRSATPTDLAHLFRRLFEHATATGSYGTAAFFGGLRELGAESQATGDLHRLVVSGGASDGDAFLARLLLHAGVETRRELPGKAPAGAQTHQEMVRRVIGRCWCGKEADAVCDPAAIGGSVTSVAGEPLHRAPLAAWERTRTAVVQATALRVVADGEEVDLFCSADSFDPTWDALLTLAGEAAPREPPP